EPLRDRQLAQELAAERSAIDEQRARAAEQVDGSGSVDPLPRPDSRRSELFARALGEPTRASVRRTDLGETARRLLEVIADDLVGARGAILQPVGRPLVQVDAAGLRNRRVGDVSDQDVVEAELGAMRAPGS